MSLIREIIITDGIDKANVGANGGLDVNIQDQTTAALILPLAQQLGLAFLTAEAVVNAYTVDVDDVTDASVGDHFRIIDAAANRYYFGTILAIATLTLTLDTPIDFAYADGSEVTYSNINMAVDGSVTPVHFHLRTGSPSIPSSVDITRILMVCQCNSAVDLNKFGDIAGGLDRGILFRIKNGTIQNIFNVKTNAGLAGIAYDWTPYVASNPGQGIHGFSWRLTFGGQARLGVVLRVEADGQLGMLIQDDLTDLISLFCVVEGHVVESN